MHALGDESREPPGQNGPAGQLLASNEAAGDG